MNLSSNFHVRCGGEKASAEAPAPPVQGRFFVIINILYYTGDVMKPKQQQQLNPRRQPETVSTASLQSFEDPEGGLPLDSPVVQAREQQCRGRPASMQPPRANRQMD
jgi:hypothetical protein